MIGRVASLLELVVAMAAPRMLVSNDLLPENLSRRTMRPSSTACAEAGRSPEQPSTAIMSPVRTVDTQCHPAGRRRFIDSIDDTL
jgi:hypothetical protein